MSAASCAARCNIGVFLSKVYEFMVCMQCLTDLPIEPSLPQPQQLRQPSRSSQTHKWYKEAQQEQSTDLHLLLGAFKLE